MHREDLGEGRERQDAPTPAGQAAREDGAITEPSPDLVASTVEALRARMDEGEREALRGTIASHTPLGAGREEPG